jgi:hypothetical protein
MKTIYKSCYFITVTAFSIGSEYCYGTVLDKFQDSQFHVNVNIQEQ